MSDDSFGPYDSRDEFLDKLDEYGIELEESGARHAGPMGALMSHEAECGCHKTMSVTGDKKEEIFEPCEEHEEDIPPFDVEREPQKPPWEDRMLEREPEEVEFDNIEVGDTLVIEDDNGNDMLLIVQDKGKDVGFNSDKEDVDGLEWSTNHPSKVRNQFVSIGKGGTLYRDDPPEKLRRKNKPHERY